MSGIVAVVSREEVALFTDAAMLDYQGRLQHLASKVLLMPEWPGAVAARGPSQFLSTLHTHWNGAAGSFDAALERVVDDAEIMRQVFEMHRHYKSEWELVLAGWSNERQAFEVWDAHGGERSPYTDFPSLTLRKMTGAFGAWPAPNPEDLKAIEADFGGQQLHPHQAAALVMQAMRSLKLPDLHDGCARHIIGGFLQRTVVYQDGCTTAIIHRWPDRIGESIDPFAAELTA